MKYLGIYWIHLDHSVDRLIRNDENVQTPQWDSPVSSIRNLMYRRAKLYAVFLKYLNGFARQKKLIEIKHDLVIKGWCSMFSDNRIKIYWNSKPQSTFSRYLGVFIPILFQTFRQNTQMLRNCYLSFVLQFVIQFYSISLGKQIIDL